MRVLILKRALAWLALNLAFAFATGCARYVEEWQVTLMNNEGRVVGTLVLRITGRRTPDAKASIARVTAVTPVEGYFPYGSLASVEATATGFNANLNFGAYDNNTLLQGVRHGNQAEGAVQTQSGAGGLFAGTFKAVRKPN